MPSEDQPHMTQRHEETMDLGFSRISVDPQQMGGVPRLFGGWRVSGAPALPHRQPRSRRCHPGHSDHAEEDPESKDSSIERSRQAEALPRAHGRRGCNARPSGRTYHPAHARGRAHCSATARSADRSRDPRGIAYVQAGVRVQARCEPQDPRTLGKPSPRTPVAPIAARLRRVRNRAWGEGGASVRERLHAHPSINPPQAGGTVIVGGRTGSRTLAAGAPRLPADQEVSCAAHDRCCW